MQKFGFPPVPPHRDLTQFELDELLIECAEAVAYPYTDRSGTEALLVEITRRGAEGLLDADILSVARTSLEATLRAGPMDFIKSDGDTTRKDRADAIRRFSKGSEQEFLFHGTLRSRLLGIGREGLVPRKRPKRWGRVAVDEHAASGVFFTKSWRSAAGWVGASAFDTDSKPTKGAVIRIPAEGLIVEPDRLSTAPGALVVRQSVIPVTNACVMLYPFSVTSPWIELSKAVELTRRKGIHKTYKSS